MGIVDANSLRPRLDYQGLIPVHANSGLVAEVISPGLAVPNEIGVFKFADRKNAMRKPSPATAKRAAGTPAKRTNTKYATGTYEVQVYAEAEDVPKQTQISLGQVFDPKAQTVIKKATDIKLILEQLVIAIALGGTVPTAGVTGTDWTDPVNAMPVDDIIPGCEGIRQYTGLEPNLLIVSANRAKKVSMNQQLRETVGLKYAAGKNEEAMLDAVALARAFGVKRVVIAGAMGDNANEGAALDIQSYWPDNKVGLFSVAESEAEDPTFAPRFMRSVYWEAYMGLLRIREWTEDNSETDVIEAGMAVDPKLLESKAGFILTGV